MKKSYYAKRGIALPSGGTVPAGQTVDLTDKQAKYLLLAGKIAPAAGRAMRTKTSRAGKSTAAKKER